MIKINGRKGKVKFSGTSTGILAEYAILGSELYRKIVVELGQGQAKTLMRDLQSAAFMDNQEIETHFTIERARELARTEEAANDQK